MMVRRYNQEYRKVAQFVPWKRKKTTKPAQIAPDVQVRIRLSGDTYNKITGVSDNVSGFINWALLQHFALYDDIYFIRVSLAEIGEYMKKEKPKQEKNKNTESLLYQIGDAELLERLRGDPRLKTAYDYLNENNHGITLTKALCEQIDAKVVSIIKKLQ